MRRTISRPLQWCVAIAVTLALSAGPALAQETSTPADATRPWHYWIAPILLIGGVFLLVALGVGYYIRVMGGRDRQ